MLGRLGICISLVICTSTGWAMGPMPGEERFDGLMEDQAADSFTAGLGLTQIGDSWFLQLNPRLGLNFGKVGVGLDIPLNLRVKYEGPEDEKPDDYLGVIRREDWDGPTEWLRMIRYVRFGHKRDFVYVRVGELAADIGHGTIVSRYMNNLDLDNFHVGLQLDLNTDVGGFETLVSDVGELLYPGDGTSSRLLGARFYLKPMALLDSESAFNIFSVGFSIFTDLNAPTTIAPEEEGGEPGAGHDTATVYGVDFDVDLLSNAFIDLVPYSDFNMISGAGWGLHLGLMVTAKLPIGLDLAVPIRVEYRRFSGDYAPQYFGSFYDIERSSFPMGSSDAKAKKTYLEDLDSGDGLNGYYADLAFDFAGLVQIGAIYEGYDNSDPNLGAFLNVPALDIVKFKAYYERSGITGSDDIFKFDERSFAVAEGRYQIYTGFDLVGRFTRRWVLGDDGESYESEDSWNAGVEWGLTF